jgi:uncharacterized protein (DUF2147 family)
VKRAISRASAALIASLAFVGAAHAGDPNGVWLREGGKGTVRISPCGDALCGIVASVKDPESPARVGQKVFYGMVPAGENNWSGHAFNPDDGRTYAGTMALAGNNLTTSGCVLGGLICKTVHWSRVK